MKDVIVAKFGGSSLANATQFTKVKNIVEEDKRRRYIVPSAPGKRDRKDTKVTDLFYLVHEKVTQGLSIEEEFNRIEHRFQEICNDLGANIDLTEVLEKIKDNVIRGASKDYIASRGEYLNGIVLSKYLGFEFIDPKECIVFKENGRCDLEATEKKTKDRLMKVAYGVIPGFYGTDENGKIVTFSRGGSDVTGSIIANAVKANLYENWTDVSGFLIADPNIVKDARTIKVATYQELRELSYMGAPVLHDEVIFPLKKHSIPINLKNTNRPQDEGTMIVDELTSPPINDVITGISGRKDFTVITVDKIFMNSEVGFIRKLAGVFEDNHVSIEHMPSSIDSISAIISNASGKIKLDKILEEIQIQCEVENIIVHPDIAIIAVVGRGLAFTKGISGKIFTSLAEHGVNIRMISQDSRELNIIIGIENYDYDKAIKAIYSVVEE